MGEPAENYVSIALHDRLRGNAYKVWAVASAVAFVWLALIVLPPVLAGNGAENAASPLYSFFSHICHQLPERSFFIFGHKLAVCSRCFGVYFGLLAGLLTYPIWRSIDNIDPLPRLWLFASMVPIAIDWSLTIFGIWENTFVSRSITGLILGFACGVYILPALVEIFRHLFYSGNRASA